MNVFVYGPLLMTYTGESKLTQRIIIPDYPGKCYDEDTKTAYAVGENVYTPGICEKHSCHTDSDNQTLFLEITG